LLHLDFRRAVSIDNAVQNHRRIGVYGGRRKKGGAVFDVLAAR
jgi:hypothetical protein